MRFGPTKLSSARLSRDWPALLASPSFPTATAAVQATMRQGYNTLVVRSSSWPPTPRLHAEEHNDQVHLAINLSYTQGHELIHGLDFHDVGFFATIGCDCKSKSHIVTNFVMRPLALSCLEHAGYGVHAVTPSAPALGLTIFGRFALTGNGHWEAFCPPTSLIECKPAPFKKLLHRLKLFGAPTLSIMARCTCFNTYILSVMPYTASYFGLDSVDLNKLRQYASKFILGRQWIEAEILPYVLRYVGIAVLLDPALSATVSATGLYFRGNNRYEDLWLEHANSASCNLRQKSVVLDLLHLWQPYVPLQDIATALADSGKGVNGRIAKLKQVVISRMVQAAQTYLRNKVQREGWSRGVSWRWVDLAAGCPKKWCNGIARYTLLRWAVNQDDDVWLTLRGTRHGQLCGLCQETGESFPHGFYQPPLCESCIRDQNITPISNSPVGSELQATLHQRYIAQAYQPHVESVEHSDRLSHFRTLLPANEVTCVACGCGDNTIGHWTRWCVIPLIIASILVQPSYHYETLNDIAVGSSRAAAICTLVLAAFRRLLRQEGAFVHQQRGMPRSILWWCETLIQQVCQDATKELRVPLLQPVRAESQCIVQTAHIDMVRVLPVSIDTMHLPPIVNVSKVAGEPGDRIGVLPINSLHNAVFRDMCTHPVERSQNVDLSLVHCRCGEYHVHVTLSANISEGELLVPSDFGSPKIFCQFDGSAHRAKAIGGAGAALYTISMHGLQLIDWICVSIAKCKDNVVAEVVGADLTLTLYERYVAFCMHHGVNPLPLDRIQGDILPLLSHLRFQTRLRRQDLLPVINRFHARRSRLAPHSATEYRPREANFVADYLAGQGSAVLLQQQGQSELPSTICEHQVDPPYELLLQHNASIAGKHAAGKFVLALSELPDCTYQEASILIPQLDLPIRKLICEIALSTRKFTTAFAVEYVTSSTDGAGRLYARQACAQNLPKLIRSILYARTHQEVDMVGAHYEIIRRYTCSISLPPIAELRSRLVAAWGQSESADEEDYVKMFPIRVINSGVDATLRFLRSRGLATAGLVSIIAYDLHAASRAFTEKVLASRPDLARNFANRNFFACEFIESQLMVSVVKAIQRRHRCTSIIWLHDGLWISKSVPLADISTAERDVLSEFFPQWHTHDRLFRCHDLFHEYLRAMGHFTRIPESLFVFPAQTESIRRKRFTRSHPGAMFTSVKTHETEDAVYAGRISKRSRR